VAATAVRSEGLGRAVRRESFGCIGAPPVSATLTTPVVALEVGMRFLVLGERAVKYLSE
jgi:hypothetical protein